MLDPAGGGDLAQRLDAGLVDRALVDVEACSRSDARRRHAIADGLIQRRRRSRLRSAPRTR